MNPFPTVKLPVVELTTTIREAFARLAKEGTSALVLRYSRPVVITDQSLRSALVAIGNNKEALMQRYIDLAFEPPPTSWFSRTFRATTSEEKVPPADQKNYVVEKVGREEAVVVTDFSTAAMLRQPSAIAADLMAV